MQKRQRFSCQRNVWIHTPQGGGRGGVLRGILGGGVVISDSARCMWNRARVRVSWLGLVGWGQLVSDQKMSFFHTRFPT